MVLPVAHLQKQKPESEQRQRAPATAAASSRTCVSRDGNSKEEEGMRRMIQNE